MHKTYLNWSSGKDAMLALHKLQNTANCPDLLVSTINSEVDRVSMHGLPISLLEKQTEALQMKLHQIPLNGQLSLTEYNKVMHKEVTDLLHQGYKTSVFGDILLEDLKAYREKEFKGSGIQTLFPLWKKNTSKLIKEFIELGYKAIVVCTNSAYLDDDFCGRIIDHNFLKDLPDNVDPCGENGEFHTFVFDGSLFKNPVTFEVLGKVQKNYQANEDEKDDCFKEEKQSWDHQFCFLDIT
ncbi:Dph6-related ATP pyrophosphatase [Psychroflexus halocasei]|uniref:MJ0570-related uncharacterized domain-containing protein n=1 Tax=Psychroflexus halocasei TaxID=908615 RepID=A0A1H3XDN1_9FLAO|nr:ATP-binding protein [Psychroflexus halocasei]SDZ97487.1 MJ0570-related uncharacterized domain-containing protein [Psychroflexus halocasei]